MKNYIAECLNGIQYFAVVFQTNEVLQTIQLVLSIATTLIILFFKLWAWFKKSSEDGKITADEVEDGLKIVEEAKDEIEKGDKH